MRGTGRVRHRSEPWDRPGDRPASRRRRARPWRSALDRSHAWRSSARSPRPRRRSVRSVVRFWRSRSTSANRSVDRGQLVDVVDAELGPDRHPREQRRRGWLQAVPRLERRRDRSRAPAQLLGAVGAGAEASCRACGIEGQAGSSTSRRPRPSPPRVRPSLTRPRHGWAPSTAGTKAFLDRWTASLAAEVALDGVVVNTLAPQAAAATELLVAYSDLPDFLYEPLDTMAEAALGVVHRRPDRVDGSRRLQPGAARRVGPAHPRSPRFGRTTRLAA